MSDTYTIVRLHRLPDGSVVADFESNDDNDDGIADDEVTRYSITYRSMADVPRSLTYSHTGYYGQPVTVYLDGVEQFTPHSESR